MFTMENTEGFNANDLDNLNRALRVLMGDGIEESNAADMLTNAWSARQSNDADALLARCGY
jgi:hypothetical protein